MKYSQETLGIKVHFISLKVGKNEEFICSKILKYILGIQFVNNQLGDFNKVQKLLRATSMYSW